MFELTPLTTLLLFVGLLTTAFLVEAIRYWQAMRLHDRAIAQANMYWGHLLIPIKDYKQQQHESARQQQGAFVVTPDGRKPIHPDLIVANLSEIERRIIADAMYRGEDLPGVGPSFAD